MKLCKFNLFLEIFPYYIQQSSDQMISSRRTVARIIAPRAGSVFARSYAFKPGSAPPAPPRLSEEDQKEWERLQKRSTGPSDDMGGADKMMARRPKPEFEGNKNPKTGEIGGPNRDPLR